ncbi:MAG: hypothetical protein AAFY47_12295 [Pseudomonadota bacterium]
MVKLYALAALEAADAAFGFPALHDPDGVATPCQVTWKASEADGGFSVGGRTIAEGGRSATIARYGDFGLPTISNNDVIELTDTSERFTVIGDAEHPDDDPDGMVWQVSLEAVTP